MPQFARFREFSGPADKPATRQRVENRDCRRAVTGRDIVMAVLKTLDQCGACFRGGAEALCRIFCEQSNDDRFERARYIGTQHARWHDRRVNVLRNYRQRIVAGERHASGGELVKQDAERVQIGAAVDGLAQRLLGRHVSSRADDHSCA